MLDGNAVASSSEVSAVQARTSGVSLDGVTKVFANGVTAVADVTLDIADGEFLVLVGPSGCGKSTLLRLIAGLDRPTQGAISIGGTDVTSLPARERDIAMVFQNYALYPHMTVRKNLAFGLKFRKLLRAEIDSRVNAAAATLGLGDLLNRKPAALSGGQRQRVAIGRAMVREPRAFLMDEPLSNLDAKLRVSMRAELARLHERLGVTTVYVTHDQVEAMTLGHRVAVMRNGVILQCDSPTRLFRAPADTFVAAFIGSPAMNLVQAEISEGALSFGEHRLLLPAESPLAGLRKDVILGIRPTSFKVVSEASDDGPVIRTRVDVVEELGAERHLVFRVAAVPIDPEQKAGAGVLGDGRLLADEGSLFIARVDSRGAISPGDFVNLALLWEELYAFDVESHRALALT
jgi:multiple sugar transport system ATP-binding protein